MQNIHVHVCAIGTKAALKPGFEIDLKGVPYISNRQLLDKAEQNIAICLTVVNRSIICQKYIIDLLDTDKLQH